jgi:hypothetical protein
MFRRAKGMLRRLQDMWMPPFDPAWEGKVQFYELVFGTWTVYVFLVWMWQSVLKEPLDEWRYAMITFLGAGAFWINHYFLLAPKPTWLILINLYTVFFLIAWWKIGIAGRGRSAGWKLLALIGAVVFTVAFIAFEQLARAGVEKWGMTEFCWMATSFLGFIWLIRWRGKSTVKPKPVGPPPAATTVWRGIGGNG